MEKNKRELMEIAWCWQKGRQMKRMEERARKKTHTHTEMAALIKERSAELCEAFQQMVLGQVTFQSRHAAHGSAC